MENKKFILERIKDIGDLPQEYSVAAGFDMVIDTVSRMIRKKDRDDSNIYFQTIEEFSNYLLTKKNMSCSIEMEIQEEKIGGNMAIFCNALGGLGVKCDCIGSMGYPRINPMFQEIHKNCTLHSVSETVQCSALEFNDGKIMLSTMDMLKDLSWERIVERLGYHKAVNIFQESRIMALLNWSELTGATKLFHSVFQQVLKTQEPDKDNYIFIDLSDASRKPWEDILEILKLTESYTSCRTTVLSLNENECRLVYRALFGQEELGIIETGQRISSELSIDYLILHLLDRSYGFTQKQMVSTEGFHTPKPKLSTGGGDNFNAGLCLGFLNGLSLEDCLYLGNAVSGYYVRTGKSPDLCQLYDFIKLEGMGI